VEGVPYKVEGVGQDKVPGTLDMNVVDDFVAVTDKESFAMARRLTREEGLFVGGSSGLIVHVAVQLARRLDDPNALIVAILPDTGERYLSKLYSDEWMRENQMLEADRTSLGHVLRSKPDHKGAKGDIVFVTPGHTVRQALRLMQQHDVSQLPVMDGANCVGSVSDWSLSGRSLDDAKLLDVTVSQVMDPPFPIVDEQQTADSVAKLLSKSNPAVLVRTNGRVTGIVTRSDLLSYLMSR
jgi:cystathionine beta-synthase